MRHLLILAPVLLLGSAALADRKQDVEDCEYWLLSKDDAEKARRLAACDRIIGDKRFTKEDRAMAYAERARFAEREKSQ